MSDRACGVVATTPYVSPFRGSLTIDVVNFCTRDFSDGPNYYTNDAIATVRPGSTSNVLLATARLIRPAGNTPLPVVIPAFSPSLNWTFDATFYDVYSSSENFNVGSTAPAGYRFSGDGRVPLPGKKHSAYLLADSSAGASGSQVTFKALLFPGEKSVSTNACNDPFGCSLNLSATIVGGAGGGTNAPYDFGNMAVDVFNGDASWTVVLPDFQGNLNFQTRVVGGCTVCPSCVSNSILYSVAPPSCTVSCTATVPATATINQVVSFQGSANPSSGCTVSPTFKWTFGDGASAFQQNTNHVYTSLGSFNWTLTATSGTSSCVKSGTIAVSNAPSGCATPGKPTLSSAVASLVSGQSLSVSWTAASGLAAGGSYIVESSTNSFATVRDVFSTTSTTAVIPTTVAATDSVLSLRVRAIQDCLTEGARSNVIAVTIRASAAKFVFTKSGPSLTAFQNGTPPSDTVRLRNVGGISGTATLSTAATFFTITPSSLSIGPGAEASVTVKPTQQALTTLGRSSGLLVVSGAGAQISTPVSLSVVPPAGSGTGAKARATVGSLTFQAPAGQNPPSQNLTIDVTGGQGSPVYLVSVIGPGGSWLNLSNALSNAVPASGPLTLAVSVDRSKRVASDGVPPLRTILRLTPVGGDANTDAAIVEILDIEFPPIVVGPVGRTSPSSASFLVPVAVKQSGSTGAVFTSDGWLRNQGSSTLSADLFFTPQDADGISGSTVRKATLSLPPSNTYRLSDLIANVFGTKDVSGQVEVRSADAQSLSLRTNVDSVIGGDPASRFSTEIPTISSGSGVGIGDPELVLPGIDDDATYRANVILVETTGFPATALVTVNGPGGEIIGTKSKNLPAYGKVQIDRIVNAVSPGASLSSGWASIAVTAGSGKVSAIATVIDNRSGTFSAILAKRARTSVVPGPGGLPLLAASRAKLAGTPSPYVIPAVARLAGAARYTTRLSIVNPTGGRANLQLTYRYIDVDDGNVRKTTPPKAVVLEGRTCLPGSLGNDAIASLFRITSQSYGSILVEGDANLIQATASVEAQALNSPTSAPKAAQVNGRFLDEPDVIAVDQVERGFEGIEKSDQFRTNVILLEVDGQPCSVLLRLYSKTGEPLKERTFFLEGGRYLQINDVFGEPNGVGLGDGPFSDVSVTAKVVSGAGRVIALATVVNNVSSSPTIHVLSTPGPPDTFKTGF
ncbi:MAG: PKD domain-containing protein [Thermoanaerobaculia bacterium]